jgi:hypothetical protein
VPPTEAIQAAAGATLTSKLVSVPCTGEAPARTGSSAEQLPKPRPQVLDPEHLPDHIDRLYGAAWALCGSRQEAEDLVQETFVNVLKRRRLLRDGNEIAYLLQALRNTHTNRYRAAARRPATRQLFEDDAPAHNDTASRGAKSCRPSPMPPHRTETR